LPIVRVKSPFLDPINICILYEVRTSEKRPLNERRLPFIPKLTTAMIWSSMIVLRQYIQAQDKENKGKFVGEGHGLTKNWTRNAITVGPASWSSNARPVAHIESGLLRFAV